MGLLMHIDYEEAQPRQVWVSYGQVYGTKAKDFTMVYVLGNHVLISNVKKAWTSTGILGTDFESLYAIQSEIVEWLAVECNFE